MTMVIEDKPRQRRIRRRIILMTIIFVAIAGAAGWYIFSNYHPKKAPAQQPAPEKSMFSFDAVKAPDWRQGPSNATSMALFFNKSDCFVSMEYRKGPIDINKAIATSKSTLENDGNSVTQTAVTPTSLQTKKSVQSYNVYQYTVDSKSTAFATYAAQAYGYVKVSGGHIKSNAYCREVGNLPDAVAALQAIRIDL